MIYVFITSQISQLYIRQQPTLAHCSVIERIFRTRLVLPKITPTTKQIQKIYLFIILVQILLPLILACITIVLYIHELKNVNIKEVKRSLLTFEHEFFCITHPASFLHLICMCVGDNHDCVGMTDKQSRASFLCRCSVDTRLEHIPHCLDMSVPLLVSGKRVYTHYTRHFDSKIITTNRK